MLALVAARRLLALFDHQFGHFQTRLMFVQLIAQQLSLHCQLRWIGPWRSLHGVLPSQHGAQTCHVEPRRLQFVRQAVVIGTIGRGVQFDQYLPLLDLLPVLHVDGVNDAALQRLNDFGVTAWNDFALGCCHDIDGAEGRPEERRSEHGHDRPGDHAPDRGRRSFLNLQHGGEKLPGLSFGWHVCVAVV